MAIAIYPTDLVSNPWTLGSHGRWIPDVSAQIRSV